MDDDAVDAARQRRGRGLADAPPTCGRASARRRYVLAEARVEAVLGEERRGARALLRQRARGPLPRLSRDRSSPRPTASRGALPILADDFVTTEDGTGIVHLAPAFGEDDYRVAAAAPQVPFDPTRAETLYNPVRARRHLRRARRATATAAPTRAASSRTRRSPRELIEDLRARGLLLKVRGLRALLPALLALRHAAALLRQTVLVHRHLAAARGAARGERDRRAGIRRTSSTGASATG